MPIDFDTRFMLSSTLTRHYLPPLMPCRRRHFHARRHAISSLTLLPCLRRCRAAPAILRDLPLLAAVAPRRRRRRAAAATYRQQMPLLLSAGI